MAREILSARDQDGNEVRFALEVFEQGAHWTSTLARLDAAGAALDDKVAPRFYGTTAEQARRRMLSVLENQYEDIQPVQSG